MRKGVVSVVVLTTAFLLGSAVPGFAGGRGGGAQGGHGAGQVRGSWHTGFRGNPGGAPHPAWHGGFHGPGVAPHHAFVHDRFRGHPEVRTRVFIHSGFWWGEPASLYYAAPPVVVQAAPPVYIQQGEPPAQQPYYWDYCPNPAGYSPYVKDCPGGWMTVIPPMGAGRLGARETRGSFLAYEGPLITFILSHSHGQELGLTPEQTQKLQELRTTFEKEAVARRADIRAAEIDLNGLLEKDQWDVPAIEAKVKQLATLQGDLRLERIKTLAAGRALLTPEQLQKLKTIAQWRPPPGRSERMGPGPPSGPGRPGPLPTAPGTPPAPRP